MTDEITRLRHDRLDCQVVMDSQQLVIERLRAALSTARLYIADQMIASAIVVPEGEEPDASRHPSLLQTIDAVLGNERGTRDEG